MDCRSFREQLESAALRPEEAGADPDATGLAAHLQRCVKCRREFAVLQQAAACVRTVRALAHQLPQDEVDRMEREIMRGVRATATARGQSFPDGGAAGAHRWLWRVAVGSAALAAALVVLLCGLSFWPRERVDVPQERAGSPAPAPLEAEAATSESLVQEAQQRFEAAGRNGTPSAYAEVVDLCRRLLGAWPDSSEAEAALGLITSSYPLMADREQARTALTEHARRVGERMYASSIGLPGIPVTDELRQAAERRKLEAIRGVFSTQIDALLSRQEFGTALEYADLLRAVCPEGEPAEYAEFVLIRCLDAAGEPALAVQACEKFLGRNPRSGWGVQARTSLPAMLWNAGRRDEAVAEWKAYASGTSDPRQQACGYYNAGALAMSRGPEFFPEAIACFGRIPAGEAVEPYRSLAKAALDRLQQEMTRDVLDDGI